jgi:hypothetical protein
MGRGQRGQGRIGASLVARGRTLNEVTLQVTSLFFFSCCPTPQPGHHSRVPWLGQAHSRRSCARLYRLIQLLDLVVPALLPLPTGMARRVTRVCVCGVPKLTCNWHH